MATARSGRSSAWLERYVRDVEVARSNRVAPTELSFTIATIPGKTTVSSGIVVFRPPSCETVRAVAQLAVLSCAPESAPRQRSKLGCPPRGVLSGGVYAAAFAR